MLQNGPPSVHFVEEAKHTYKNDTSSQEKYRNLKVGSLCVEYARTVTMKKLSLNFIPLVVHKSAVKKSITPYHVIQELEIIFVLNEYAV